MSKPTNEAAWYVGASQRPLEVKSAPYPCAKSHDVVIKNAAVAINPIDYKLQQFPFFPFDFPGILGEDVSGEVVEVGDEVTNFKAGDRVLGIAGGAFTKTYSQCAFQHYTVCGDDTVSRIPDSISFEAASTIPLCLATAAVGLFQKDTIGLSLPKGDAKRNDQVVLIWGGTSSVGCNAIQLSTAAGYEVFTTASASNNSMVKSLGAKQVFDYKSPSAVGDIAKALEGKTLAGVLDCINIDSAIQSCDAVRDASNNKDKTIATVLDIPDGMSNVSRIFALSLRHNKVAKAIYQDFLPRALEQGIFVPAPKPLVVGTGLESIQKALDTCQMGVSARKVVVKL